MPRTKREFTRLLSLKMNVTEEEASRWVDAYTETLIEIFKTGEGVSISGLGGFYLSKRRHGNAFKFNPSQRIRQLLGWSSGFKEG